MTNGCSRVELNSALKFENVSFGHCSAGPALASSDVKISQISGAKKATPIAEQDRFEATPPTDARGYSTTTTSGRGSAATARGRAAPEQRRHAHRRTSGLSWRT